MGEYRGSSGPDGDNLEDKSSVESILESQISDRSDPISQPDGETTPPHIEINEKFSDHEDLRQDDRSVDDEEELGLIDNENHLQEKKAENITENDVVQCEEYEETKSENQPGENTSDGESQEVEEKDDNDDRNTTGENNDDGNLREEKTGEHLTDQEEEDSWEYEWEDEEDNEFEFFEVDEDEYKVQTFDGSFSIAI